MRVVGLVVLGAVALSACGGEPEEGFTPVTSSSSTTSADADLEAAKKKALEFKDLLAEVATTPKKPLESVDTVARGDASNEAKHSLAQLRGAGMTAKGDYSYRDVEATRLGGTRPTVEVRACVDRSGYEVHAADGTEQTSAHSTSQATFTVQRWGDQWFVTKQETSPTAC